MELNACSQALADSRARSGQLMSQVNLTRDVLHDIGSPISSIILYSELLLEQETGSYARERLSRIRDAAQKCQHLLDQWAAIVQSDLPMATPFSIGDLCAAAAAWAQPRLAAENVQVVAVSPPDLPPAIADRGVLLRTILTLLYLARRASRATDRERSITLQVERQPGNAPLGVRLTVRGGGPEQAARPFDAVPAAGEIGDDGLQWLGAQAAVASQGGRLWAETPPEGGGTTFVLDLPAGYGSGTERSGWSSRNEP